MTQPTARSGLAAIVLEHLRSLIVVPVGGAFLVGIVLLLLPRWYTVGVSLQPRTSSGAAGGLAGVAAQFGVSLGTADAGSSPDYYAELVLSRRLLLDVVEVPLRASDGLAPRSFIERNGFEADPPAVAAENAAAELQQRMTSGTGLKTGLVYLTVRDRDPVTAVDLVEAIRAHVNEVDAAAKQQRATTERRFIGERLDSATTALRGAENDLEAFLVRNREYQNSPTLTATFGRLTREVAFRQQVQVSLAQAHEQARIDEVRATPSLIEIAAPIPPARPDRRGLVVKVALTWMVLLFGFVLFHVGRARLEEMGLEDPSWLALASRLRRPWREFVGKGG